MSNQMPPAHPFDDDKLQEECGVFGVIGVTDAANFVALGLHALQHRGQEAGGIVCHHPEHGFNSARRFGYVRDNFTKQSLMETLPGPLAIGHVRYSTAGGKGRPSSATCSRSLANFPWAVRRLPITATSPTPTSLRKELIERGSIFQSTSDSECIIHLMARSLQRNIPERMEDALRRVEGAFSIVAMTRTKLIGVRDPLGVRPLVLGKIGDGWVLSSETCALDIIGAEFVREIEPGEMVVITLDKGVESHFPFRNVSRRGSASLSMSISRVPIRSSAASSVYETRRQIGIELAKESPVDADLVCPVPDSGTPAAIGFSHESGIPYAMGIIRNQYMGRTFIEPTEQIRNMGVRLKLNVNRALIKGKRVILVDDSVVRGTTSRKIKEMILDAGAKEVHFRIASPPTAWPCFYGVDTPQREKLLAATMSEDEMREHLAGRQPQVHLARRALPRRGRGQRAATMPARNIATPVFPANIPVAPSDQIDKGFELKAAE